jgi:hypothetical protein
LDDLGKLDFHPTKHADDKIFKWHRYHPVGEVLQELT